MHHFFVAQIVGFVAALFTLAIYQFNSRKAMLALSMLGAFCWSVHFIMLGATTGAAMNLIAVGWSYTFTKVKPTKNNSWVLVFFLALSAFATYLTWQGYISLLAMAGDMVFTIAFWSRSTKIIRRFSLTGPPLWFIYNAFVGSYPGMLFEIFSFTSNLVGQYRFDIKTKKKLAKRWT